MAAPSIARPRSLPRFSGLAWRRARWGYVFIAPWIIGFLAFTLFPMVATLAFTFTNINLAQAEPLKFVGLHNYETLINDRQTWGSLGVTVKFALLALPVAVILPFLVALMLHSRHLRGPGGIRGEHPAPDEHPGHERDGVGQEEKHPETTRAAQVPRMEHQGDEKRQDDRHR